MFDIVVAHIIFDSNYDLKSVDIVDKENQIIETETMEQVITGQMKKDFYVKILVEECNNLSNGCFGLSNGTYYRLNFDGKVDAEFLKAQSKSVSPSKTKMDEFNNLIVKALKSVFEKSRLENFKELIVETLSQPMQKRELEVEDSNSSSKLMIKT